MSGLMGADSAELPILYPEVAEDNAAVSSARAIPELTPLDEGAEPEAVHPEESDDSQTIQGNEVEEEPDASLTGG